MVEPTALSLADDKLVPIEDVELGMLREVVSVFCCDDDMTSGLTELDLEASDQSCDVVGISDCVDVVGELSLSLPTFWSFASPGADELLSAEFAITLVVPLLESILLLLLLSEVPVCKFDV